MTHKRKTGRAEIEKPGVVERGALYTSQELRARLQWGEWAWRRALRSGLKVLRIGRMAYVTGDDAIDFVLRLAGGSHSRE